MAGTCRLCAQTPLFVDAPALPRLSHMATKLSEEAVKHGARSSGTAAAPRGDWWVPQDNPLVPPSRCVFSSRFCVITGTLAAGGRQTRSAGCYESQSDSADCGLFGRAPPEHMTMDRMLLAGAAALLLVATQQVGFWGQGMGPPCLVVRAAAFYQCSAFSTCSHCYSRPAACHSATATTAGAPPIAPPPPPP